MVKEKVRIHQQDSRYQSTSHSGPPSPCEHQSRLPHTPSRRKRKVVNDVVSLSLLQFHVSLRSRRDDEGGVDESIPVTPTKSYPEERTETFTLRTVQIDTCVDGTSTRTTCYIRRVVEGDQNGGRPLCQEKERVPTRRHYFYLKGVGWGWATSLHQDDTETLPRRPTPTTSLGDDLPVSLDPKSRSRQTRRTVRRRKSDHLPLFLY